MVSYFIHFSGDGLFAKTDIKEGMVVSFYNGYRFSTKAEKDDHGKNCPIIAKKYSKLENADILIFEDQCKTYRMNSYDILINIPPWENDLNVYNATLAHKVNNEFEPRINALFGSIEHPRFGFIPAVLSSRDIRKDEEILLDYGYFGEMKNEAEWYFELKAKRQKENDHTNKKFVIKTKEFEIL